MIQNFRLKPFLLFLVVGFLGCATSKIPPSPSWKSLNFDGLILDRQDPKIVEWYSFGAKGIALATFGEKHGPLCGPVVSWKLSGGILEIRDENKALADRFQLLKIDNNQVTVRNKAGETVIFLIKR